MEVLLSSPGVDLTTALVERFRRDPAAQLIVPTATLGEHLRNELARKGELVRPHRITTFSKLLFSAAEGFTTAPSSALEWLVGELLERSAWRSFEPVRHAPGFRRALVGVAEELHAAGASAIDVSRISADNGVTSDLASLLTELETNCRGRGWLLRHEWLQRAAEHVNTVARGTSALFAGFYSFTPAELRVIQALAAERQVTIALPVWAGSEPAIAEFKRLGAVVGHIDATPSVPARCELHVAPTMENEVEAIAAEILKEAANGRPFREMGVVVRSHDPYVPLIATTFERFGIPARIYFGQPLREQGLVQYLNGLLEALTSGWNHGTLLRALRSDASPFRDEHWLELRILERMPGKGLEGVRELFREDQREYIDKLEALSGWLGQSQPVESWAERFAALTNFVHIAPVPELDQKAALVWRQRGAALKAWGETASEAAQCFSSDALVDFNTFLRAFRICLDASELRVPDHRRDVVHVIDAFEARQWRLPVIFVCGLYERHFPHYTTENPLLPDPLRVALRRRRFTLRTSAEKQADEGFLFDLICRHATERLVASYPKIDTKGNDHLPSFFLRHVSFENSEITEAVHPKPSFAGQEPRWARLQRPEILHVLQERLQKLTVSAIDEYLKCPYSFFVRCTLHLREPVADPFDRFNFGVQGSLAHKVLERHYRDGLGLEEAFDVEFESFQSSKRLPSSYRVEAVRLEVLENLRRYLHDNPLLPTAGARYESEVELMLDGVLLKGRVDRVDFDNYGRPVVIDYKYSARNRIKNLVKQQENGEGVQVGLYLRALHKDQDVGGMIYAGFRGDVIHSGWVLDPSRQADEIAHLSLSRVTDHMQKAVETTERVLQQVRSGYLAPQPTDACRYCMVSEICRVEKTTVPLTAIVGTIEP